MPYEFDQCPGAVEGGGGKLTASGIPMMRPLVEAHQFIRNEYPAIQRMLPRNVHGKNRRRF